MKICAPGITVKLPNNKTTSATHTALIDIPNIPLAARKCHIFPDMDNKALLSIAQFCDNGYHAIFTPTHLTLEHQKDPQQTLQGTRDTLTGMWSINLNPTKNGTQDTEVLHQHHIQTRQANNINLPMQANNVYDFTLHWDIIRIYTEPRAVQYHLHGSKPSTTGISPRGQACQRNSFKNIYPNPNTPQKDTCGRYAKISGPQKQLRLNQSH